ncbi:MAG: GDP-mannose-dependent alpha-(1-6)-phosphatidylinositol monomannoside mannosyltransferase [bacterium ADurb.Bin212]|nr:MAG: GDP-mannose-dependent alpha-(1-6)-phosphatidylinositol monomannoside mannosyltransferase [bacterium ADurb.Bin212]
MNIALVHDWITNVSGAERVLLIIKEIFPEADIYTSVFKEDSAKAFADFDIKTTYLQNYPVFRNKREALIPYAPVAFESLDLSGYDLVISNTTFAAKGVITKPETAHVCYCHTPTRYLWEQQIDSRANKGCFSGVRRRVSHKLRVWDYAAAQRPDYFLANSYTVQRRINKYYGRDSEVVYPPVNIDKFQPVKNPKADYYLFVSRLIRYKKADLVIEAFNVLGDELRIIGAGPEEGSLRKIAKGNIKFLGKISDEELTDQYSNARAFIFPAEEDFGIVPVEAMASGRPVIAYNRGGASETVVQGVTGELFKEQTRDEIIDAVKAFNPDKYDIEAIRNRAENFSEQKFKKNFKDSVSNFVSEHRANFS